jgi:hypothetical protein
MKKLSLTIIILALILSSCNAMPWSCASQSKPYFEEVQGKLDEWQDAFEIANSTPRMSLAGPLGELQKIKRDTGNLEYPECALKVQNNIINAMEETIDGFLAFMSDDADTVVNQHFKMMNVYLGWAADEMEKINNGEE